MLMGMLMSSGRTGGSQVGGKVWLESETAGNAWLSSELKYPQCSSESGTMRELEGGGA